MESWVQSWRPRTNAFLRFFQSMSLKCCACHEKIDARLYEVLHLSRKITLANLKIGCSKMQPVSGNQRPDLLTSLMNMSLVLRLPRDMHLCGSSSHVPRLPSFLDMLQNLQVLLTFGKVQNPLCLSHEATLQRPKVARTCGVFDIWLRNVLRATMPCTFSTSQLPLVVRHWDVLYMLTSKCASRHNGVHCCDISTSKSPPNPFEKWSEHEMFCAFWLGNVLRATTACNFSSLIRPDSSAPEPQIIEKTLWFATFLPFPAPASSFFWLFLFSDLLSGLQTTSQTTSHLFWNSYFSIPFPIYFPYIPMLCCIILPICFPCSRFRGCTSIMWIQPASSCCVFHSSALFWQHILRSLTWETIIQWYSDIPIK